MWASGVLNHAVIFQYAQTLDFDFDDIAVSQPQRRLAEGTDPVRGAGDDYVPGLQGECFAELLDELRDAVNDLRGI